MTAWVDDTRRESVATVEWITLGLIVGCYAVWFAALFWVSALPLIALLLVLTITLHASLTHEVLHGHPFRQVWLNETLMWPALNLCIPYARFRDLHLAHHRDARLTDPYDDPESNYLDPKVWARMPGWKRALFAANNTLLGRIVLGPAIGQALFMQGEWRAACQGDREVIRAWVSHAAAVVVLLVIVTMSGVPVLLYLLCAYAALGVLKIRTFLEHRAHDRVRARTVIIEDRGLFAFLFLNNNLHVVHHMNPSVPWYRLPALYRGGKARYLATNDGYVYRSYAEVFRRYFWRAKDPVAHPLWPTE